ncbi:hypothetical protein R1flu_011966 [Riccia fluitans]|uniref:Uncharacterized protein n=1 Tax=Riccia fluitans TaxID=41844 RepID=A0ABD1ZAF5_9MARC
MTALDASQPLHYPSSGADTVFGAVGSFIMWDISKVKKLGCEFGTSSSAKITEVISPLPIRDPLLIKAGLLTTLDSQYAEDLKSRAIGNDE